MDIFYSIVSFFTKGGAFMLPILLVATVGAAIAIERYVTLTRMRIANRNAWRVRIEMRVIVNASSIANHRHCLATQIVFANVVNKAGGRGINRGTLRCKDVLTLV